MRREEVLVQVQEIFIDAFDRDDLVISEETTAADIEGWDSLMQMNLIEMIEAEFEIKFELEEVVEMEDVGAMVELILAKM